MTTTLTQKGQITIPVELRRQFGLNAGTRCMFTVKDGQLVIIPLKKELDVEDLRDILASGLSATDDFIRRKQEEKKLEL